MRAISLLGIWITLCASFAAGAGITHDEYKARRQKLRTAVPDGIIILVGGTENDHGDVRSPFFQEPNFYYLTGWKEPGAVLVLTRTEDILLLPARDAEQERWTGSKLAPGDAAVTSATGFGKVMATETLEVNLPQWVSSVRKVYTLSQSADTLKRLLPLREIADIRMEIARLRMVKSPAELDLIQKATDVGMDAHRAAWKATRPGLGEWQIAAVMSGSYFGSGCERHAYAPIVGSGKNSTVLHYGRNERVMDGGDVLLMDVGPECSMYATDITRTIPVNGKFTPRQREIYQIVLGAQKAAIDAIKPGVLMGSRKNKVGLQKIAADYMDSHGKGKNGEPLSQYFIHGLGHHVGLDVHDAYDPAKPLEAGMVVTIEPGIYIPEEGIGVRIEDMVLVTEDGAKLLSGKLPREIADIEREMQAGARPTAQAR